MSSSIRIEAATGIAIITCSGTLRRTDAQEAAVALWKRTDWAGRTAVWDFRSARFDVSSEDARQIASFILHNQPTPPPAKIAFVAERDLEFGMTRVFEAFRKDPGTELRVFRAYDEAVRWAGVQEPEGL